nr:GNAT family N-acetyltransferase [Agrobacterium vitis]
MFVHPEYHGLGVASVLMGQVAQKARELGLDCVRMEASITAAIL